MHFLRLLRLRAKTAGDRRATLIPAITIATFLFFSDTANAAEQKPNILWLIAEDFGPALGCYGQEQVHAPHLDGLARGGVRYERFYTTAPVCSPARSAFMTGMYQHAIGAEEHRTRNKTALPVGVRTLPEWMRAAGYFTANIRTLPPQVGFNGTGKTDWNFIAPERPFDSDDWAKLTTNQPFFAQINFPETHRMMARQIYRGTAKLDRHVDPAKIQLPPYYPDHPIARQDYARYLEAAMELDRKIGRILTQLETAGLASNTIVVFMGDNGEAHVRGKQFCYEEGLRVPLIIRWAASWPTPKHFTPGQADFRLLEAIDLAPTFLTIATANIPERMQGKNFLGATAAAPKEFVFGARDRCDETELKIRTVRDARYRYIRNLTPERPLLAPNTYKATHYPMWNLLQELNAAGKLNSAQAALAAPHPPVEELYDLESDPHQIHNLAPSDNPEHQRALARLRAELERWSQTVGRLQPAKQL